MTNDLHIQSPPFVRPLHANKHCRHYGYRNTGLEGMRRGDLGGPQCAAGVDLSNPGAALKCMPDPAGDRCAVRAEFTADERATWESWRQESMKRMLVIMPAIPGSSRDRKTRPYWGKAGEFDCPACKIGKVRWVRAISNGHVQAACTTPNCFAVLE